MAITQVGVNEWIMKMDEDETLSAMELFRLEKDFRLYIVVAQAYELNQMP